MEIVIAYIPVIFSVIGSVLSHFYFPVKMITKVLYINL